MSNRDADARYEVVQQGIPFYGAQLLKRVHTSLPGVVVAYDAAARRARVQPAVDLLLSPPDNPTADFGALIPLPKPVILDVPVIHLSGGGYTVHVPLAAGDPVMLLFAERDIAAFKLTLETGPPISDDVMEIQHAVCIPGFVPLTVTLAGDGLVIQANDGLPYVHLRNDPATVDVRLDAATHAVLTPAAIDLTAATVTVSGMLQVNGDIGVTGTVDGVDVSTHTHPAGTPPGNTGVPN